MASFSRKRKRGYRMLVQLAAESHVPRFQERVGTVHLGYMIPDRLPWRLRARPSATLHEIQVRSEERTCSDDVTEFSSDRQGRKVSSLAERVENGKNTEKKPTISAVLHRHGPRSE